MLWDVGPLGMRKQDFLDAIDMAPSMKPFRHTYLHEKEYRDAAKNMDSYFLGGKSLPFYMLGLSNASGMFDITMLNAEESVPL